MNIRDHANKFTIFVYMDNVDRGAAVKVHLAQAGYDAYYFQEGDLLKERALGNFPHVILFATSSLKEGLNDFVTSINSMNPEIRLIAVTALAQFDILAQYRDHGILQVIVDNEINIEARALYAVDTVCEALYSQYQNEQIFDSLNQAKTLVAEMEEELRKQKAEAELVLQQSSNSSQLDISFRLNDYQSSESKEELLTKFMLNLKSTRAVYFKFLPSVHSFVATHSSYISLDQIQGVGARLELGELKDLGLNLGRGLVPNSMVAMLSGAFEINPAKSYPVFVQNQLEGVWIIPGNLDESSQKRFDEEFALMALSYRNMGLEKRISQLEVQDPVTELFNRDYYFKKIEEEAQRAKRIQQPLSVARLMIDDFYELENTIGEQARDGMLKAIAEIITKSSRGHDITCRISQNEFSLILPHCGKKGAALRAERIRRAVESSSILDSGVKITVSLGVSEYPSLCTNAKSLDETAGKALMFVANKGGNKICLFKAPETHHPDFQAPAE